MSAINLPARAYRGVDGTWYVSDDANSRLCRSLTEPQAKQIAIALNLHDPLVDALNELMAAAIHCDPNFENRWPRESAQARDVLARAETANETKS